MDGIDMAGALGLAVVFPGGIRPRGKPERMPFCLGVTAIRLKKYVIA